MVYFFSTQMADQGSCLPCARPRLLLRGDLVVRSRDEPPLSPGFVLVDAEGRIVSVGETEPDASEYDSVLAAAVLAPGLIDIHNHGVGGSDHVLEYWRTPGYTLSRLPKFGTTGLVATIVFDQADLESTFRCCDALNGLHGQEGHGAVLCGIHDCSIYADLVVTRPPYMAGALRHPRRGTLRRDPRRPA